MRVNVGVNLGPGTGGHVVVKLRVFVNSFIGIRTNRASLVKDNVVIFNGYEGGFTIEGSSGIDVDYPSVITAENLSL